ncbi:MAG: 50S ribosomal protein L32 [Leptospirillia bacterium]
MPQPKRKTSKSVKGKRRTHKTLSAPTLASCSNCSEAVKPHHVCGACGHYNGREVITTSEF